GGGPFAAIQQSPTGEPELVASQLLAQGSECLVGGQGAGAGLGGSRLGGVAGRRGLAVARSGSSSVVGSVLRNLLLVGFPTGLGVSVLLLPSCALCLVALEPFV